MKLYATPLSHFSRKVRILLDLHSVPYEFIDVGNVAEGSLETFIGNPLLKVPVLDDQGTWLIESDHIAEYVTDKFDSKDSFKVRAKDVQALNTRAVLNGIMSEEVKIILAKRTGVPTGDYVFFDNAFEAIHNGLQWLESNGNFDRESPGYKEFHLTCVFEHLAYYDLLPLNFRTLRSTVDAVLKNPKVKQTSPFVLKPKDIKQ